MDYRSSLNSSQRKIIETIHGPVLVIAGAGSGKTRVITHRIVHMINNIGISPSRILALTFTNKAAKEMKMRISNMLNQTDFNQISLGTFHSIFSGVLRKESHWLGYKSNYTIYDQRDSENVIKKILDDFNFKTSLSPTKIRRKISEYKNNLKSINNEKSYQDIKKIYEYYVKRCLKSEALDFDDILLHTNYLFFHFPKILHKYQEKFQYILIDEYQDTNFSQNTIIKNLSLKHRNIFAVGDDAQSIYAFRGANISNILNFHTDYNEAKIFRLEQNYRSTNHIVQVSNKIISFNKNQIFKKIWTNNEKGEKVKIYGASSEKIEAQYIASSIYFTKRNTKFQNKDFAILYRTNTQSNILEQALKEKKIPYKIYGSISFYKRKGILDFLAYLKIITNPNEEESLLRINKKKIGNKKAIKLILNFSKKEKKTFYNLLKNLINYYPFLRINKKTKEKLENFILTIEKFRLELNEKNTYTIAKNIANFFLEEDKKNFYNADDFQYILENISIYLKEQKILKKNGDMSLSGFLRYFSLKEGIDEENEENQVSLMTIHSSKGLEFSVVFIAGLEENLFPSKSSLENELKLEEERRLFYVAITRAQKKAILTYAKSRFLWGKKIRTVPSRFIQEISEKFIDREHGINNSNKANPISKDLYPDEKNTLSMFKKGVKVFHKNFGMGIILDIQNGIAIIKFQQLGIKKILLKIAKLVIYS
ncbi:DNA helicase II / ATP-dependent DNA helicase PcrA [Blattabacterium sp. (Blatta orientalis) str. Tarazona]|uniref:ATP-dependent helicase n=1 Tax=Blattabacterium sp. (Blatta orientalis) TaxID=367806 RepID=UPI0002AD8226|nr:DNA helicase II / ATP-dependent DNA helicase PcrA [Blattabacterium sp. (Blatta orientalis) str. Tarazona]